MFGSVATSTHAVDDYEPVVGRQAVEELRHLAAPLEGLRLLALSSPRASGAVRSLLQSSIPLLRDLGVDASWQQVRVSSEHLAMDRTLRRALSGYPVGWTPKLEQEWWEFNRANAQMFDQDFDIVIVHHTGSVGLHAALSQMRGGRPAGIWLWDSHRDYRAAVPEAWALIRASADSFDASVYDYRPFIRLDAPTKRKVIIPPGVDPLGPRSRPVTDAVRQTIADQRGLRKEGPILAQIVLSHREDDPIRILETYELVRARRPDTQLLVINLLSDGSDLANAFNRIRERGKAIGGVTVLTEMDRVGNVELSALRDEATVLLHQGMPRGISIELLEEMWQGRPIVSGRSPVAEAVLTHPRTGVLADTPVEQARAVLRLLNRPAEAERIGQAAKERVASQYLITHHLAGYLKLFQSVTGKGPKRGKS
jgi:trehalose synthase